MTDTLRCFAISCSVFVLSLAKTFRAFIFRRLTPFSLVPSLCAKEPDAILMSRGEWISFSTPKTIPGGPYEMEKFSETKKQPDQFLFYLKNARVLGPDGIIVTERDELFGEGSPWGIGELTERCPFVSGGETSLDEICIHANGRWNENYFHWMFDILARLAPLSDVPAVNKFPLLIPEAASQTQKESLRALGFTGPFIHSQKNMRVKTLIYTSPVRNTYCPPLDIINQIRSAVKIESGPARRLYISREDAESRHVSNEQELSGFLAGYGFEKVTLCGKSFQEQINLFGNATHVIGAHGSGLVNLMFCKTGTWVLELFGPQYLHGAYYGLSDVLGLDYRYLIGQGSGCFDMKVSVEDVKLVLEIWDLL